MDYFVLERFRENSDGYADSILSSRRRTARRIENNDTGLTSLTIGLSDHCPPRFLVDHDDNAVGLWENLGADVARNTHITELAVGDFTCPEVAPMDECLEAFFRGAAGNRSIRELTLHPNERPIICKSMAAFLENNGNIESLTVGAVRVEHKSEHLLALAPVLRAFDSLTSFSTGTSFSLRGVEAEFQQLMQALSGHKDLRRLDMSQNSGIADEHCVAIVSSLLGPNSKLEELNLRINEIGDEGVEYLSRALVNNTLTNLNLSNNDWVTAYGWEDFMRALSPVLQLPNCALTVLDLECCEEMDDGAIRHLGNSLKGNLSLKDLYLRLNREVTCQGWAAFSEALACPSALEALILDENYFDDRAILSLTRSLAVNGRLKLLDLHCNHNVTADGWSLFSDVFSSPTSALEELDISDNYGDDATVASLANTLTGSTRLKSLSIGAQRDVTPNGWSALSPVLRNQNSVLETLNLGCSEINDVTLASLANAIVANTRLRHFDLVSCENVTSDGWAAFAQILSPVLQNNTSSLERINLESNKVGNAAAIIFANSLTTNKKLKELILDADNDQITADGWSAFERMLGNTQSIWDTYNSNHTLETLDDNPHQCLSDDMLSLLLINKNCSSSQAARMKIIYIHFGEGFAAQPFVGMELKVLPHALAWMGKEGDELERFWCFVRSMPLLFGIERADKKRKRDNGIEG